MIGYVLFSYVVMFFWCLKWVVLDYDDVKVCFKVFLVSPLSFPLYLISSFIRW